MGFLEATNFRQRKTTVFAWNTVVFMVAEAGLEPTTSGLWVDITLLNVRKTKWNDRNVCVYGGEKSGVSERIWSWRPALGSKWGQNFRVKWNDSRKWIIQKQLLRRGISGLPLLESGFLQHIFLNGIFHLKNCRIFLEHTLTHLTIIAVLAIRRLLMEYLGNAYSFDWC